MEREKKRKSIYIEYPENLFSRDKLAREAEVLKNRFPTPPFWEAKVDFAPLYSFYRAVLRLSRNIVFLARNEVAIFLESLFQEYSLGMEREQSLYFCSDGNAVLLQRLAERLPLEETMMVILPRRIEEFKLLTLSFSLPWKKVFLGSTHGVAGEIAKKLFFPFCPLGDGYHYFWHRGALAYLPLLCGGIAIEEMERGFQEGYPDFQREAAALSLLLSRGRKDKVYFLVDDSFLFSLLSSLLPTLKKSCQGEQKIDFLIQDFFTFWDTYGDLPSWEERFSSTLLILIRRATLKGSLCFRYPSLRDELTFEEWRYLNRASLEKLYRAESLAFRSLLKRKEISWVELLCLDGGLKEVGHMMALFHQWICYNAWLRGLDLLNDPPVLHFEGLVKNFLKKNAFDMEAKG